MKVATGVPRHLFTDEVDIERKTEAADARGGVVETWASHIENLRCAIQPVSTEKARMYGADRANRVYTLFCEPGKNITTKDRVVVTEDRTGSDVTRYFEVIGVRDLVTGGAVLELDMEAVDATP